LTWVGGIPSHAVRCWVYRRLGVTLDKSAVVYWRCRFFAPSGVSIGARSIIGNDAFLDGRGGLVIREDVDIGAEVRIYTRQHAIESPTFGGVSEAVVIDNWVYIGSRVTILPGAHVGEGAVLASGCVLTGDAEPWTVYGGVPGRPIGQRPQVRYQLPTSAKLWFQ
jgi:maltose O-acetyltransferase